MSILGTFLLTVALIGAAMLAMAVGVLMRRPCLRGSCGGPAKLGDGRTIACVGCPNKRQPTRLHRLHVPDRPPSSPPRR